MARAYETGPRYSRATRNNSDVTLGLDGSA